MRKSKYTKELLQPLVENNKSLAGVIKALGLKLTGSNYVYIKSRIDCLGLDTTHFLGQAANCGSDHKCGNKRTWQEILIHDPNRTMRQHAWVLRRALVESGREYKCEWCGLGNVWNGKPIKLAVDHVEGDWQDNRPEKLRFLCPNCHSQTDGHSGSQNLTDDFTAARFHREWRKRKKSKETYDGS